MEETKVKDEDSLKMEQEFSETALPELNLLFRVALRLTRDEKDAEDLVQETYLKAYRAFPTFKKGTNIRAWMITIMRNTYFNIYSKKSRQPNQVSYECSDGNFNYYRYPNQVVDSAENEIMRKMTGEKVREEIDRLPDIFRLPVYLVDIEGFSYSDAAEMLDVPIGTIMSRLHRGRKSLAEGLITSPTLASSIYANVESVYQQT